MDPPLVPSNEHLQILNRLRILEGKIQGVLQAIDALNRGFQCLSTEINTLKTQPSEAGEDD